MQTRQPARHHRMSGAQVHPFKAEPPDSVFEINRTPRQDSITFTLS